MVTKTSKQWSPCYKNIISLKVILFFSIWFCALFSKAQHVSDTLKIKPITIFAKLIIKEEAGKTSLKIDSVSMIKALTVNLSDLISQNTPIFIKEYGRGAMATASFRGTAPSHTQVLWNGVNLNSPMLGMVDFSMIPVYFTDNVTLLYGSASLSERSGALGGIVKLENSTQWHDKLSGRFLTGVGSYGSKDEFIKISGGNKKIQSQTRAFYNYSDNDYPFVNKLIADIDPETGSYLYPTQRNLNSKYQNYGLLQEIYLHPTPKTILTFRYWYQHNERTLPRLLTNETDANANINRQSEQAHRPLTELKYYGNKGILNVSAGANIQLSKYLLKTKISGAPDQIVTDSRSRFESYFIKASYNYQLSDKLSFITSANSDINQVNSTNTPPNQQPQGYDQQRIDHSLSVQLSNSFNDRLSANISARQDITGDKPTPVIPSAGIEYHPLAVKGYFLKGSLSRNYHQPSLNDLYYIPGGNPRLKAEEGYMADVGSGLSDTIGTIKLHGSITGYCSGINNWIIWLPTPQGYWEPYNMKRVNTSGLEFNVGISGKAESFDFKINGNYAVNKSINRDAPHSWADESVGKQLPFIPRKSANLVANISTMRYHFTWLWTYYSERFTTSSNDKSSNFDVLYPYYMNNLNFGKEIHLNHGIFNLEIKILNLFNETYRTVLQNQMPGRNYSLLIRYDF